MFQSPLDNCKFIYKLIDDRYNLLNISETEEFLKTCPEGLMTKRKFVDLSSLALGGKSEFLADALFRDLSSYLLNQLETFTSLCLFCFDWKQGT